MVQPYPSSAQLPEITQVPAPAPVRTAVKVMYAGAAASLINMIIQLATVTTTKNGFARRSPDMTASQLNGLAHALTAGAVAGGVIGAAAWLILARACGRGQNWARVTGTVLFAIATADLIGYLVVPFAAPAKIFAAVVWLTGLTAVVLLWRGAASAFFGRARP
ncbi:MAG TPA: hypothetical protein VH637_15275 [Streptosporangiaceae bacterium]|jgi:hypothetical protein